MATKTALEKGDERSAKKQEPGALQEFGGNAMGKWEEFTGFLRDVRADPGVPARREQDRDQRGDGKDAKPD